jgi:hypothetical protein
MNQIALVSPSTAAAPAVEPVLTPRHPGPTAVKVLLPVWGYRFVRQFLDFTLPTLLAPGNLPALASALPCQFVILTAEQDEDFIREHPAWQALERICDVEIVQIDDLIMDGNYSTTITLAYALAVRRTGEQMIDTCFIFLVSDYLMADGALGNVLKRMQTGVSAVLAGNFQIIAEEAIPLLTRKLTAGSVAMPVAPRELLRWTFNHLHAATTANIVNYRLSHNAHTNRLFWRVDENTLIGRFYLMHPIAIRPEVADFVVGSSFDYSFVPEMCPSGKIAVMTDSDEYLVVEMQPREHEVRHLQWGPIEPGPMGVSLAEWTTAAHRQNVKHTLVFHAGDNPPELAGAVKELDQFVETVNRDLPDTPQPHRNHHYWIGAIAVHRAATGQALTPQDWEFLLGEAALESGWRSGLLWRLRQAVFGAPPAVQPWHPQWPDYRPVLNALEPLFGSSDRLLVVSDTPRRFGPWLARRRQQQPMSIEIARLLGYSRRQYMPWVGKFDVCLLFLREANLSSCDEILRRLGPLLRSGGHVLISIRGDQGSDPRDFGRNFASHSGRFVNLPLWVQEIRYVRSSRTRWRVQHLMERLGYRTTQRPKYQLPFIGLAAAGTALVSYVCNLAASRTLSSPSQACSSVFIVLHSSPAGGTVPLPQFRFDKRDMDVALPAAAATASVASAPTGTTSAPTGAASAPAGGLETFGATTNQLWHRDPRQLALMLARYRFVAKLLSGRHTVGEYGCADAFGTRLVLQEVRRVTVYDRRHDLIEEVRRRHCGQWAFDAHVHDIVQDRLPEVYDSIYSIGAIEQVGAKDEEAFARNLCASLYREQGILIVGGAAPGPFEEESPNRAPGGYRRSGAQIRALMSSHFHTIVLFSMSGETVLAGNVPGAQYLFALCSAKKA